MLTKAGGVLNLSQDELANNMDLVQTNGLVSIIMTHVASVYMYLVNVFFS